MPEIFRRRELSNFWLKGDKKAAVLQDGLLLTLIRCILILWNFSVTSKTLEVNDFKSKIT